MSSHGIPRISGLTSRRGDDLFIFIYKFDDTINANRFAGLRVDEYVSWVHIFKMQAVTDIVHTLAFLVVAEAFNSWLPPIVQRIPLVWRLFPSCLALPLGI